MDISVVVPVYRGAETLPALVRRLEAVLGALAGQYEIILVDDGSPDESWAVITRLAQERPAVRGIQLMRNYGQHNATLCGVRQARHEVIVTMDDDLQNPPEEITKLLKKLAEGYDVVYGVARRREQAWWKNLFSLLVKRSIALVMGLQTVRDISAFKAFRTRIRSAFEGYNNPDVLLDVLFTWGTNRFAAVTVEEAPRETGRSNYSFWKLVKVSLLILTSYTTVPLRLSSILGFFFMLLGFCIFIYILVTYLTAGSIPGFPFLASTITLFSGVQLFSLGILGEYLARTFERTGGRPTYSIAETTDQALHTGA